MDMENVQWQRRGVHFIVVCMPQPAAPLKRHLLRPLVCFMAKINFRPTRVQPPLPLKALEQKQNILFSPASFHTSSKNATNQTRRNETKLKERNEKVLQLRTKLVRVPLLLLLLLLLPQRRFFYAMRRLFRHSKFQRDFYYGTMTATNEQAFRTHSCV